MATPEQRKALPPDVEAKLEKVEQKVAAKPTGGPRFGAVQRTTTRARVLTSTDKDVLMLARFENAQQ